MLRLTTIFLVLVSLLRAVVVYGINERANGDTSTSPCMQQAARLLEEAVLHMRQHYYRKDYIHWDSLIVAARTRLRNSGRCEDTYETITWCFRQINETHSFIMGPAKSAVYNGDMTVLKEKPNLRQLVGEIRGEMADDSVAYLTVPWVSTTDSITCVQIADSLQYLIAQMDEKGISRWIIDLRKNSGGNCWPMIAGIGPLLGEGICGYFVSSNEKIPISYQRGVAQQGKYVRCQVSRPYYQLKSDKKSIVILTGRKTSSSGEIIALAFKGKEDVYFFGEPTAGYTTANATYTLSDNSMLVLTVCQEADRIGRICEGRIVPDEFIKEGAYYLDAPKSAAMLWLHSQSR